METPSPAVTATDAMEWLPCNNCGLRRDTHLDGEKCLFEASSYVPLSFDIGSVATWVYQATEVEKPKRPYPEPSKYDRRKERVLAMKFKNRGRR